MMKRDGPEADSPHSKRQRVEHGRSQHQGEKKQDQSRGSYERPRQPRQMAFGDTREGRQGRDNRHGRHGRDGKDSHDHQTPAIAPLPPVRDATATLITLLTSLAANPDALPPPAHQHATQLLDHLTSRDKSISASLDLFQPATVQHPPVPPITVTQPIQPYPLPALPALPEGPYSQAVFIHKSTIQHDRVSGAHDLTYEKLEFLGDAYLEIVATRLIFSRYPYLPAGRQAQARERIVKNDTLAQFSVAYGFRDRLQASDIDHHSKTETKILADVFEAYVAAVTLSDPDQGFSRVETWLTELWAPILLQEIGPGIDKLAPDYNSNAKADLQKKIMGPDTKLDYQEDRPMEQSKHAQKYFVSLYLTGYGYEKKRIGYGEGRNKAEAGNRAATHAMHDNATIVDDAARQLSAAREKKRLERLEKETIIEGQSPVAEPNSAA